MPVGRRKTNFEPAMIFSLDHLKKDDLKFDIDAEIARFKTERKTEIKKPKIPQKPVRPTDSGLETKFP